jgi:uncharacterized protein (DUF433 family)
LQKLMSERIVIDPKICHGKPVIRGTRIPVPLVVGSLAGGMSFEELQRECDLSIYDIRAALKFAGELVEQEQHHALPGGGLMRFLIDANMPRSNAELLKRYDHEVKDVRDIGMGSAADSAIAAYAQRNRLALVTRDFDLADIRKWRTNQTSGC